MKHRGELKVDITPVRDSGRPLGRDFVKHNDVHGKSLTTSAVNALQKMFNLNGDATHVSADGQGKIAIQPKDVYGNPANNATVYDIKLLWVERCHNLDIGDDLLFRNAHCQCK
jgi:hypothetical protein